LYKIISYPQTQTYLHVAVTNGCPQCHQYRGTH